MILLFIHYTVLKVVWSIPDKHTVNKYSTLFTTYRLVFARSVSLLHVRRIFTSRGMVTKGRHWHKYSIGVLKNQMRYSCCWKTLASFFLGSWRMTRVWNKQIARKPFRGSRDLYVSHSDSFSMQKGTYSFNLLILNFNL